MRYESAKSPKGNVGVSWQSQELADAKAAAMDAANCTGCTDCTGCTGCTDCTRCTGCTDCTGCTGVLKWTGDAVESLLGLNGLYWPVAFSKTHIQIGCQNHSIGDWDRFTDAQIVPMDRNNALPFWKANKTLILSIARREQQ